jgi:hypothetical protein
MSEEVGQISRLPEMPKLPKIAESERPNLRSTKGAEPFNLDFLPISAILAISLGSSGPLIKLFSFHACN